MYNIFANIPAVVFAIKDVTFSAAGLTSANTQILYKVGQPMVSWVPTSPINILTGFEKSKGYLIMPLLDIDLTDIVQTEPCPPNQAIAGFAVQGEIDFDITADAASFIKSQLIGEVKISVLTRDGDTYSVVEQDGTKTAADLAPKLQVLFDNTDGSVYAQPDNPFTAGETIHISYRKAMLP